MYFGTSVVGSVKGKFLCNGEEVGNSALIVVHGGSSLDIVTSAFSGSEAIAIPQARFNDMLDSLCHHQGSLYPRQEKVIRGDIGHIETLRKNVIELLHHTGADQDAEHLRNTMAATVSWFGDSLIQYRRDRIRGYSTRSHIAKLAQEYLEDHFQETVRIEDICKVTGASARSLQRSFREYFDLTITNYLKMLRLDAARRDLVSAHLSDDTVARIATKNGFMHLGRFSVEYHKHFSELPRETLVMQAGK